MFKTEILLLGKSCVNMLTKLLKMVLTSLFREKLLAMNYLLKFSLYQNQFENLKKLKKLDFMEVI